MTTGRGCGGMKGDGGAYLIVVAPAPGAALQANSHHDCPIRSVAVPETLDGAQRIDFSLGRIRLHATGNGDWNQDKLLAAVKAKGAESRY